MKDKLFLIWLHQRLIEKHREKESFDFMNKLRAIIHEYPEDKDTNRVDPNKIKTGELR